MDERGARAGFRIVEEAGPGLRGLDAKAVFARLDRDYEAAVGALEWFVDNRRADEALRLASGLARFWTATKRLEDGSTWLDRAAWPPDEVVHYEEL